MEQESLTFSIIIPTRNRPDLLAKCLRSIVQLEFPRDQMEVIVVDDGSDLAPESAVLSVRDRFDVRLFRQSQAGPAAARNAGARKAKGNFLVFLDDDCIPRRDWLEALAGRFTRTPDHAIGGRTLNALPENIYSTTSQVVIDFVYGYYNANPDQARFFASNNIALPSDRFLELGGFDESFTTSEDREFCSRWLRHGYRMTYAPEVVVSHAHALNFFTFWRQHFNYGRGAFRFRRVLARGDEAKMKLEAPSFYRRLLSYPFSLGRNGQVLWLTMFVVISQAASAAGFLREWMAQRGKG